ncbi:hypothetical protein SEUCBS139899_005645 [Sporothrix eucalyptigena]
MGSFVLDFSAYNALLSSNGHGTSYYGADDAYLGGGDPGLSVAPGRRPGHLHHHLNQHHHQQQQQQQQHGLGQNSYPRHQISNRYIVYDRNSLPRLEAEKTYQDRRKHNIANFGSTWLKPPGVAKTLFQIREECREQEEQAEAERREELAQQLAQAEAAALEGADGTALEDGAVGDGVDLTGEPGGATDLMGGGDGDEVIAGMDADMMDEDAEQDLDNDVPDADAEDFSFGNNDDEDDPFASSSEEEDEEDDGDEDNEDGEDDAGEDDTRPEVLAGNESGDGSLLAGAGEDTDRAHGLHYTHHSPQHQRQDVYVSTPATAAVGSSSAVTATVTPVRSIEEQRAQARARAAERREMRQMRAAEDRMRAMRAHPRLSSMGMGLGIGLYGGEEDLDEEDQAQMLQEDDLVREASSPNISSIQLQQQHGQQQGRRRHRHTNDNDTNIARGNLRGGANNNSSSFIDDRIHQDDDAGFEQEYDGESGLEMDMDADLDDDGDAGAAMDLSAFGDADGYEHTDTEAELSSSVVGGDDDNDEGHSLPHQNFLALAGAASGSSSMAAPRSSGIGMGSMGHGHGHSHGHGRASGVSASGGRHRQQLRSSLARSDRNSMDISSLLSQDGSSAFGSSPQMRRL